MYEQPLPTGTYNYYAHFTPGKERQAILFLEDIKGRKTARLIASNGTGSLVDLEEQVVQAEDYSDGIVRLKVDKIVPVFIPKDDPVQNLEGKYRELMYKFFSSGFSDFASYSTAQSLKAFALSQGYSFQQVQSWDIGAYPSGTR